VPACSAVTVLSPCSFPPCTPTASPRPLLYFLEPVMTTTSNTCICLYTCTLVLHKLVMLLCFLIVFKKCNTKTLNRHCFILCLCNCSPLVINHSKWFPLKPLHWCSCNDTVYNICISIIGINLCMNKNSMYLFKCFGCINCVVLLFMWEVIIVSLYAFFRFPYLKILMAISMIFYDHKQSIQDLFWNVDCMKKAFYWIRFTHCNFECFLFLQMCFTLSSTNMVSVCSEERPAVCLWGPLLFCHYVGWTVIM